MSDMNNSSDTLVLKRSDNPFIWFKVKDKGVERGFSGVKKDELKQKLEELRGLVEDNELKKLKSILNLSKNESNSTPELSKAFDKNANNTQINKNHKNKEEEESNIKFFSLIIFLILQSNEIDESVKVKRIKEAMESIEKYLKAFEDCKDPNNNRKPKKMKINLEKKIKKFEEKSEEEFKKEEEKLKEKFKEKEEELRKKIEEFKEKSEKLIKEVNELMNEAKTLEEELEEFKKGNRESVKRLKELGKLKEEEEKLKEEFKEKEEEFEKELGKLKEEEEKLKEEFKEKEEELGKKIEKFKELKKLREEFEKELGKLKEEFEKELGKLKEEFEKKEDKLNKFEKSKEELIKQLIYYDNFILYNNAPENFRNLVTKHKELQEKKKEEDGNFKLYDVKSEYIIKGDNVLFAGMSIPGITIKNIIRNLVEDNGKGPETNNKNIITEFFALKFAEFLGGKSPKQSYIIRDTYEDKRTEKLMIASRLHENFNDFQGKLINSNTNEEQIGSKNYNRLIPNKQKVDDNILLKDDYFNENGELIKNSDTGITTALLVLSVLNDLDGVGAQGQNIGYNTEGDILFFDFGHSFKNTPNLGAGLYPQLGFGNVKSRNIQSFFAGIPLKNQLGVLKNMLDKFDNKNNNQSEFDKFVENILDKLNGINETYKLHIRDTVKPKIVKRIDYMRKIFKNRLDIFEEENGGDLIDVLDNLQLLIFEKNKSELSKNGVVLKEGTKYFDIKKEENNLYRISLKGKSKYGEEYEIKYEDRFLNLVKKFRGSTKDAFIFSMNELLDFKKFLLEKRLKQVEKLNDEEINKTIIKDIGNTVNKIKNSTKKVDNEYIKNRCNQLKCKCKKLKTYNNIISSYKRNPGKICYLIDNFDNLQNIHENIISDFEIAAMTDAACEFENISQGSLQKKFRTTCLNSSIGIKCKIVDNNIKKGEIKLKILGDQNKNENMFNEYKNYTIVITNLPTDLSINYLIANIRTYGLEKGVRKTKYSSKVEILNEEGNKLCYIPDCFNKTESSRFI